MVARLHMSPSIFFILGILSQQIFILEFNLSISQIIIYSLISGILMLGIYYAYEKIIFIGHYNRKSFLLNLLLIIIIFPSCFTIFYIFYKHNLDISSNPSDILGEYGGAASTVTFTPLVGLIIRRVVNKWELRRHRKQRMGSGL